MCSGTISESEVTVPSKEKKKNVYNTSPEAPNDDFSIYDKIWATTTQGEGVFVTPQFTIKIPESTLEEKREAFWSKF